MAVFMDDIANIWNLEEVKKGYNWARMVVEKKFKYGLKKTKYVVVTTRKENMMRKY